MPCFKGSVKTHTIYKPEFVLTIQNEELMSEKYTVMRTAI